jgi:hypothetical protein
MQKRLLRLAAFLLFASLHVEASEPRNVSGIFPHLATYNGEGECGTGAVVPWADRLWVVSYAPHKPTGSTDRLYEITPGLKQIIRPESIGGTPANRMIHRESQQLFIGPYVIGSDGAVRVIPYANMYGRHTGVARHLADPTGKVVFATMEEGFYEVDVQTLHVTELWADEQLQVGRHADLPGYHGKGFYSAQGRYVYANNGEHGPQALVHPEIPSGCLAEWDGKADRWTVVRRNQFTEVTGPGGVLGNSPEDDRLWSIGWDHRSLILMLLDNGRWQAFRLPKASHCYDGAHGWNTEWPRIREIGEDSLLMTMHGGFWRFPRAFSARNSAGIVPRSTYLKVIGDFCRWGNHIVMGCDDTAQSEFLNKEPLKGQLAAPGRSQSNLWFVDPPQLDRLGPSLGRGALWLDDDVKAGVASEPFLFSGYAKRSLWMTHRSPDPVTFTLEVDRLGNGQWRTLSKVKVPVHGSAWIGFTPSDRGQWIRLVASHDVAKVSAVFQYRGDDLRNEEASPIFSGVAGPDGQRMSGGVLHARGEEYKTLRFLAQNPSGALGCFDLDGELNLRKVEDSTGVAWTEKAVAVSPPLITHDDASALYVDSQGKRWRLPKGDPLLEQPGPLGASRLCREVCTERNLLNAYGTFYELPAENAGGFIKIRPIATHNRQIHDFASYRGLLVMSGVTEGAKSEHIVSAEDGKCALWVGAVDDLWSFGKPRGTGGPWKKTAVKANVPSDAYLASGYDRKRLTLSHESREKVSFHLEADFAGDGRFYRVATLTAAPGQVLEHQFPDSFGAYWLRLVARTNTVASAKFTYN